jgi:hypothetical protein
MHVYAYNMHAYVSCGVRDRIKEKHLSLSSMDVVKGGLIALMPEKRRKGLIALMPEIDCDEKAIGVPPVTSAEFPSYVRTKIS